MSNEYDVAVIGAGFGGLYAVHKFRDDLGLTVRGFDAGGGVGGTWWWNRYPGARCDIASVHYSYSFSEEIQREWHWSERYAAQPEILAYLEFVADRLDLGKEFTFNVRVCAAVWDEESAKWTLTLNDGTQHTARFIIAAGGNLSIPKQTDEFPGLADFDGEVYFTSRWPHHEVDFSGKRVGVIGTGSTGIQVIQEVGKQAGHLTVFQRTPNYATPLGNAPLDPQQRRWLADNHAEVRAGSRESITGVPLGQPLPSSHLVTADQRRERYDQMYDRGGFSLLAASFADVLFDQAANDMLADYVRERIRGRVTDPATADLLCPIDYPYGTKRPPLETGYYETFNRENVQLVDLRAHPIRAITPAGVLTEDREYPLDVLIMATGFDAVTGALRGMGLRGRGGRRLDDMWADGPASYLGVAVAGFPNLFTITGPTSAVALYNNPLAIEDHVDFAGAAIQMLLDTDGRSIEATEPAQHRWHTIADGLLQQSLFVKAKSWYMGDNVPGKPRATAIFVGTGPLYRAFTAQVQAAHFAGFAIDGQPRPLPPLLKLDVSAVTLLDMMLTQGATAAHEQSIEEFRDTVEHLAQLGPPQRAMTVLERSYPTADGERPVRIYRPPSEQPLPVIVYYHGGGFIAGSLDANDNTLRALAGDLGVVVIAPSYRLAPEHPFPAAVHDAFAALQWAAGSAGEFGGDPQRIVVAGESAGGNLAAVTALRARDDGGPHVAGQVLVMPVIDGDADTASRTEFADAPVLTTAAVRQMWATYIGDPANSASEWACPDRAATLSDLPPTLIVTAECDPLRDEGEQYGEALRKAGVDVTVRRLSGLVHASFSLAGVIPRASEITEAIADHLRAVGDRQPPPGPDRTPQLTR